MSFAYSKLEFFYLFAKLKVLSLSFVNQTKTITPFYVKCIKF